MKKLFVLGALALATLSMSAQDYTGKWFVGGNYSLSSKNSSVLKVGSTDKKEKNTDFTVAPLVGYFFAPTMAVGAELGFVGKTAYGYTEGTAPIAAKQTGSNFYIAPLVRKYIPLGDNGFNLFGELALPIKFGSDKTKAQDGGKQLYKETHFDINLRATVGFDYIINERFSFETSMNLATIGFNSTKPDGGKKDTSFNANINPGEELGKFKVGFKVLF